MSTCPKYTPTNGPESKCHHFLPGGFCKLPSQFRCTEYIIRKGIDLTYSSIRNYLRCPRLFQLADILGIQLREKSVRMLAGSIVAEVLETYHLGGDKIGRAHV